MDSLPLPTLAALEAVSTPEEWRCLLYLTQTIVPYAGARSEVPDALIPARAAAALLGWWLALWGTTEHYYVSQRAAGMLLLDLDPTTGSHRPINWLRDSTTGNHRPSNWTDNAPCRFAANDAGFGNLQMPASGYYRAIVTCFNALLDRLIERAQAQANAAAASTPVSDPPAPISAKRPRAAPTRDRIVAAMRQALVADAPEAVKISRDALAGMKDVEMEARFGGKRKTCGRARALLLKETS
jgi:hypothetical protein